MSLFDERDLPEMSAPDYPGERLIVCRSPLLAAERARKREELLAATERGLSRIVAATARRHRALRGEAAVGMAVGAVADRHKVAKHFDLKISDDSFTYRTPWPCPKPDLPPPSMHGRHRSKPAPRAFHLLGIRPAP